jgi:putative transcriptional regulator
MEPLKAGQILVAEPFLGDPNFERSVILLTGYDERGATGFVLNQLSPLTLFDLFLGPDHYQDYMIYQGGPVQEENLYFLHNRPDLIPNAYAINHKLYWGGDIEALKRLIDAGEVLPHEFMFFMGYAGWTAGQLEGEIAERSWIVLSAKDLDVFEIDHEHLWRDLLLQHGGPNKMWAHAPQDPLLN